MQSKNKPQGAQTHGLSSQETDKAPMNWGLHQKGLPLRFRMLSGCTLCPTEDLLDPISTSQNTVQLTSPLRNSLITLNRNQPSTPTHELLSSFVSFSRLWHIHPVSCYSYKCQPPCPTLQPYPYLPKHSTTS